jgi:rhamnogalacturonyl hydrolase YesR
MEPGQLKRVLTMVAEEAVRQRQAGELQPHWGDAVLIEGLARASAELGLPGVLTCAESWLEEKFSRLDLRQPAWEWGYLPVVAWGLPDLQARPDLSATALDIVEQITSRSRRSNDVMVTHEGRPQIWVDSMFFSLPALFRASSVTGDDRYARDAERQLSGYVTLLLDARSSFFIHCWDEEFHGPARYSDGHFEPLDEAVAWARGNAWALLTLITGIEQGASGPYQTCARNLAAAVLACQEKAGGWHTVLTEESTYVETSASAMFALSFLRGNRIGLLNDDYVTSAQLVWSWLQDFVRARSLTGVSAGTPPGTVADYQRVPVSSETFGTGFFLLLGLELLNRR